MSKINFEGQVEIVEFYPNPVKGFMGTMHIYLPEFLMDIRGVVVTRNNYGYFFRLPYRRGIDEEGKEVIFPFIGFSDPTIWDAIISSLQKEGSKYVENVLKEKGFPVLRPFKKKTVEPTQGQ